MASASIDSQSLTGKRFQNAYDSLNVLESEVRYRIRSRNIGGRSAVVVEETTSFWDKLMSYLPSLCFLRKRFVNEMKVAAEVDNGVGRKIIELYENKGILIPYFTPADISNLKESLESGMHYDAFENRKIDIIDRIADFCNWICCRAIYTSEAKKYYLTAYLGHGKGGRECVEQLLTRLDRITGYEGSLVFDGEGTNRPPAGTFNCNLLVCINVSRIGSDLQADLDSTAFESKITDKKNSVCMVCHHIRDGVRNIKVRDALFEDQLKAFTMTFDVRYLKNDRCARDESVEPEFELRPHDENSKEIARFAEFIKREVEGRQRSNGMRSQFYRDHGYSAAD